MIHRRKLLTGLIAAPLVARIPGVLMPVKAVELMWWCDFKDLHPDHQSLVIKTYEPFITKDELVKSYKVLAGHPETKTLIARRPFTPFFSESIQIQG